MQRPLFLSYLTQTLPAEALHGQKLCEKEPAGQTGLTFRIITGLASNFDFVVVLC
jgi:hypothetical protein